MGEVSRQRAWRDDTQGTCRHACACGRLTGLLLLLLLSDGFGVEHLVCPPLDLLLLPLTRSTFSLHLPQKTSWQSMHASTSARATASLQRAQREAQRLPTRGDHTNASCRVPDCSL